MDYPTGKEVNTLKKRATFIDPVYQYPIIPNYDGFVPNILSKTGKRFMAAATAGVVEHEDLMDLLRCEKRFLKHQELLESGRGRFNAKLRERMVGLKSVFIPLRYKIKFHFR